MGPNLKNIIRETKSSFLLQVSGWVGLVWFGVSSPISVNLNLGKMLQTA